ncbi:MAG: glycosyltransferase family 4 protein [Chthoniobacterales bacterium]
MPESPNAERQTLRILVLCYEWPPVGGGGGRVAKDVAELLARRGHEVRVQTVRMPESPRHESVNGVEVYRTWGFRARPDRCSPLEMAGYVVTSFGPALSHLRKFGPDIVHAHFAVPTGALALAATALGKRPYVITAHLGDVPGAIPQQTDLLFRWLNPAVRPIWRRATEVTAVSEFVAELANRAYGRRPVVIPNGISLAGRLPLSGLAQTAPRFIFVGRLNSQKNLAFLVPLLSELRDLAWDFDIIGDGDERAKLQRAFAEAALSGRVHFHGWLPREGVERRLAGAEIFLLPSLVEGVPIAVLEALKFGLVVVGSDIPSLHSSVSHNENGWLLSLATPEAWVQILRELLTDADRRQRMRQASWSSAEKFDLERITDKYEAVLFRAASTGPVGRGRSPS